MRTVLELEQLEQVEAIAARYRQAYGAEPLNISHWDPSREFAQRLRAALDLGIEADPINYIYSYDLHAERIAARLGFDAKSKGVLITPSGTVSMLCVANWLAARHKAVELVCPIYFPIAHQADLLGLETRKTYMVRTAHGYELPRAELAGAAAPLWVTNPTYCTGITASPSDRTWLREHLDSGGTVVADECLATSGYELSRDLGSSSNFIGIYSPHKGACINAFKFSAVVFDRAHQGFFDQWADVLYGGLPASTSIALAHFETTNFDEYLRAFRSAIAQAETEVRRRALTCPSGELDKQSQGHFLTFYMPALSASLGADEEFLWNLTRATGVIAIPGIRSHFSSAVGFCFRINLALDDLQFRGALGRLFRHLSTLG